jgi:hypothetical protein
VLEASTTSFFKQHSQGSDAGLLQSLHWNGLLGVSPSATEGWGESVCGHVERR